MENVKIGLHPNNMNRVDGFSLSRSLKDKKTFLSKEKSVSSS
jgi:hypothetical protein